MALFILKKKKKLSGNVGRTPPLQCIINCHHVPHDIGPDGKTVAASPGRQWPSFVRLRSAIPGPKPGQQELMGQKWRFP